MCTILIMIGLIKMDATAIDYITIQAQNKKDAQYIVDKLFSEEGRAKYREIGVGKVILHDVIPVKPYRCAR